MSDAAAPDEDELLESLTNEALIEDLAAKIEGFDDDFRAAEMSESDEEENFDEQDLALDERILEAKRTWESLMEYHRLLERRLVQYLVDIKRRGPGGIPLSEDPGSGVRFQATLREWQGLRDQKSGLESSQDAQLREMQQTLADKRARAEEARQAFQGFVMEVAQSSEYSRTGKPIPPRLLQDLSGQTRDRANELTRVRLRWVQLRSHLARLEETLRSKEELAEGLHLIDFEQLKIENQALNEKIEERTEELSRLQRKSMAAVLVLTHVKEKLQFVEQEAETLTSRLEGYESALGGKREELHAAKVRRDRLRMATMRLKEHKTTVSSQMLLEDLGQHRARLQDLQVELEGLKRRHGELSEDTKARQEELTTLKSRAAEMAGIAA
ncbi:unnamed protein product [Pedinophyceae sp. YPF-701]|nr:unnamed protein product [Pedinophyceae sp. YPF-701]